MALFSGPAKQYYGGSSLALERMRSQYNTGIDGGVALQDEGANVARGGLSSLGAARETFRGAGADITRARGLADMQATLGRDTVLASNAGQLGTGQEMVRLADTRGPSVVDAQMRAAIDQNTRNAVAMAAGSGSQLALSNALSAGNEAAVQTAQQAAALRAQEEQQFIARQLAAREALAGIYGQQAGLGAGMYGQGVSGTLQGSALATDLGRARLDAAGMQSNMGLGLAGLGQNQQGMYLDARDRANSAQVTLDQDWNRRRDLQKQRTFKTFGTLVAMGAGGAGGGLAGAAAAGGAASRA